MWTTSKSGSCRKKKMPRLHVGKDRVHEVDTCRMDARARFTLVQSNPTKLLCCTLFAIPVAFLFLTATILMPREDLIVTAPQTCHLHRNSFLLRSRPPGENGIRYPASDRSRNRMPNEA